MIEPVFEKISLEKRLENINEQIKVECRTQVETQEVKSILLVSPSTFVEVVEVGSTEIKYNGKITFYISYLDNEGNVKKCECGSDINGVLISEETLDGAKVNLNVTVEKVEYDLSNLQIQISAILTVKAETILPFQENTLLNGENIFVEEQQLSLLCGFGKRVSGYPIEEQFELPYAVEEVIFHKAQAVITNIQCGVGCIIVDGEVLLSLVLLQKSEKRDIIKEERVLPFRMEIECEEAMPNMQATAFIKEKSFKTDVAVDEQGNVSTVNVFISLQFEGEAYSQNEVTITKDAFSTQNEIELVKENCVHYNPLDLRTQNFNVSSNCQIGEIPIGASIVAVCLEKANIISINCQGQSTVVTGTYSAVVYLKDEEKVFTRKVEVPFESSLELEFDCQTEFGYNVKAFNGSAKILSATELQVLGQIYLTIYPSKKCQCSLVKDIVVLQEKKEDTSAISVYLALKDEESFSLAKRLNVCPETLLQTNKELQFPLTGNERIVIYRQK